MKHYGYKNHTKVDKGSKFIKKGVTTNASVHDSKPVKELVDEVVGFARNAAYNTLTNLVYNLCRYEQVMRLGMN